MNMKRFFIRLTITVILCSTLLGCRSDLGIFDKKTSLTKDDYALDMNTDFPPCTGLPDGNGRKAKVILLLGQSNASGCSIVEYLQLNSDPAEFDRFKAGFEHVRINYSIDNQSFTSGGVFVPVDLTCGCGNGFFGPEVGLADVLSQAYPEEDTFILKFTMSGYSLNHHWLYDGERAWIYNALMVFVRQYMTALSDSGYLPSIEAILWMQGESDTTTEKADRYYDNLVNFAAYLREDLRNYADGEIYFIDAGISDSPYCEPGYPTVNEAKRRFADLSPYNIYFDTIEMGLTTRYEPDYDPDLGHFDSLSEMALGRKFGEALIECMSMKSTNPEKPLDILPKM